MRAIYSPKKIESPSGPAAIDFGSRSRRRHSIDNALETLTAISVYSDYLYYLPLGLFHYGRDPYRLARYVFLGPQAGDEPVKIALFAGIRGDDTAGTKALVEFLLRLNLEPERARGYQIFVYPVCNPTGFEDGTAATRRGRDLAGELWNGSSEPEAYYIERELGVLQFHGVVNLRSHADGGSIRAHVASPTLESALVRPALRAANRFLPRDENHGDDQVIPATTVVRNNYEWGLVNPAELDPAPFELTFETPGKAPPELQSKAAVAALNRIVAEYRPFLASQQNI